MFLKQLFIYNKYLFAFLATFMVATILVFYKWGAVASPVYQYGMFSENYYTSDTQTVYQIYSNNQPINYTTYNQNALDKVQQNIANYLNQSKNNQAIYSTFKGILTPIYIGKLMTEQNYTNHISDKQFVNWLLKQLPNSTSLNNSNIKISQQSYVYRNNALVLVHTKPVIDSLDFRN